jgi:hypothetical protein
VVREGQNIELNRDFLTTLANLADHQWSVGQTLGMTGIVSGFDTLFHLFGTLFKHLAHIAVVSQVLALIVNFGIFFHLLKHFS